MILVGEQLYNQISNDVGVNKLIGDRLYPVVAPLDTPLPFVVYRRVNVTGNYTKLRKADTGVVVIEVVVCDDNYSRGLNVADRVCSCLDGYSGRMSPYFTDVRKIGVTGGDEDYQDGIYLQNLELTIEVDY